jgi:hypothetical protein
MKSFAFLITLLALIHGSSAFTATRPAALTNPVAVAAAKDPAPLNMFVDWGVPEIANAPALGSIYSLFAFVSIWELVTPARKDYKK